MFAQAAKYGGRINVPHRSFSESGSVFCSVEKREPAELGPMEGPSNILGSFNYVKVLKYNRFFLLKRPNIYIVLT